MLYYQPQLDEKRGVTGVEVLLCWQHPERGFIPPSEFIPLAEESGAILPVGRWVLEEACRQIKLWSADSRLQKLCLAVNVSSLQFREEGFVGMIAGLISETGIDPTRLKLELTESLILEDVESANAKIVALKALGIRFSMDDFGTGYSSLAYLTRLPLDELKIDKSFVSNLPGNPDDEVITQTIITMGRNLGLKVVAEGVEKEEQRCFLEARGCHLYQGYLYSPPTPVDAFVKFVRRIETTS